MGPGCGRAHGRWASHTRRASADLALARDDQTWPSAATGLAHGGVAAMDLAHGGARPAWRNGCTTADFVGRSHGPGKKREKMN